MTDRTSTWSLRHRVTLIASLAIAASLVFGGLALYWSARLEEGQLLDARLEQLGETVLAFVEEERQEPNSAAAMGYHNLRTRPTASLLYRYQVWSAEGELLLRSYQADAKSPLMPLTHLGFETVRVNGEEYRAFSVPTKDRKILIQVAENINERGSEIAAITVYYVGFLLIPLGLVFGVTWLLLRRSMRSIDSMADQLRHRNPLDLTPLQLDSPPRELLPTLGAIDTLFSRVGHALSAERRFTSVAAHELRTPLAGLRAQAQLAATSRDAEELQEALQALQVGVDRASHTIEQLLDLAHIEAQPSRHELPLERVVLADLFDRVMDDLRPRAEKKQIRCSAIFQAEAVEGHGFALFVMLRNLLANAVLYSPVGGQVAVRSEWRGDAVLLLVDDAGPGIPAPDRERAFERFNRLGQTKTEGVGLGLAIVLSVVELHGARITLAESPLGGLRVQIEFQPASHAPLGAPEPAASRG